MLFVSFSCAVHAGTAGPPLAPPSLNPREKKASAQRYTYKCLRIHLHLCHVIHNIGVLSRLVRLTETRRVYGSGIKSIKALISALTSTKTEAAEKQSWWPLARGKQR